LLGEKSERASFKNKRLCGAYVLTRLYYLLYLLSFYFFFDFCCTLFYKFAAPLIMEMLLVSILAVKTAQHHLPERLVLPMKVLGFRVDAFLRIQYATQERFEKSKLKLTMLPEDGDATVMGWSYPQLKLVWSDALDTDD